MLNFIYECTIYSLTLGSIVTISQLFNARLWLNSYPKAIQDKVKPLTKNEKLWKLVVGIPFIIVMFLYPLYSTILLKRLLGSDFSYYRAFFNLLTLFNSFNLFDLLILDYLIFSYVTPNFLILKGTRGMKEYKDYHFHSRAALKGFKISIVYSLLFTLLIYIFTQL